MARQICTAAGQTKGRIVFSRAFLPALTVLCFTAEFCPAMRPFEHMPPRGPEKLLNAPSQAEPSRIRPSHHQHQHQHQHQHHHHHHHHFQGARGPSLSTPGSCAKLPRTSALGTSRTIAFDSSIQTKAHEGHPSNPMSTTQHLADEDSSCTPSSRNSRALDKTFSKGSCAPSGFCLLFRPTTRISLDFLSFFKILKPSLEGV